MIDQITWFRTTLFFDFPEGEIRKLTFSNGAERYTARVENGRGRFSICNTDGRGFLPAGRWRIDTEPKTVYADGILSALDALQRVFRYDREYAYTVAFSYDDSDGSLYMLTDFMRHEAHPKRRSLKARILKTGVNAAYRVFRALAVNTRRTILFLSETRNDTSDNMQAVLDRMHYRGIDRKYKVRRLFRNEVTNPPGILGRIRQIREIASADCLFVDDYMPVFSYLDLPDQVKLVQLWHAGFGYKLVGYARFGIEGSPHPYQSCHRQYTRAVIGNPALQDVYTEVFGVREEVLLPTGMPRLEHFLDADRRKKAERRVLEACPMLKGRRVILFAPTYRGYNQKDAFYDYSRIDQAALHAMCEATDSVLVFKWHHFIRERIRIEEAFKDRLLDLTDMNINDLMYVTDVLVTDYSSCFYDYLLLERPVVFYVYDEVPYAATRGVHYPVRDTAPGILCRTSEELVRTLAQKEVPRVKPPAYMVDMCLTNGRYTASDRILDAVLFGKEAKKP